MYEEEIDHFKVFPSVIWSDTSVFDKKPYYGIVRSESMSSQTVSPWSTNSSEYKSTCQITMDIIAKGEEQNINFWGREIVHGDQQIDSVLSRL